MVLDMTPLASATLDRGSNSTTNPRALLAAVLETTEPWELARMLEAFERSLQGLLAGQATEPLGVLLRSLQDAAKDHAQKEPFKAVVALLRTTFLGHLDTALEWSSQPEHALVASWMIKIIGHEGTVPLLQRLQQGTAPSRRAHEVCDGAAARRAEGRRPRRARAHAAAAGDEDRHSRSGEVARG